MKRCVQINIGNEKYQFDIDIEKESDLLAPFHDLISKTILKNPDNLKTFEKLEELKVSDSLVSNPNLKNILQKPTLSDDDIEAILSGYAGNTNIYNISAFFNATRQSEGLLKLNKLINNVHLMRTKFDTSSFDVFISEGATNRVIIGNKRTVITMSPSVTSEQAISLLSTIYAINQLREPTSNLFKAFREFVLNYNGNLKSDIENLSMMDKIIYLFANPNLDEQSRSYLNGLVSNDISNLVDVSEQSISSSSQENALLDVMLTTADKNKVIGNGKNEYSATIKELLEFRNGLYTAYNEPTVSEEEFKQAFGLETVDPEIYKSYMFGYLVKHKNVAELVYSQLNEVKGKTITEKLNKAVNSLLLNGVTLDSKDDKYIPSTNISIKSNTRFNQNRCIKVRHDFNYNKNSLIVSNKEPKIRYDASLNSIFVNPNYITKNFKEIKGYISKYGLRNIKFEQPSNIEGILNLYRSELSYVLIKDGTPNDIAYAKAANALGYQISLYTNDNTDINKYLNIMPVYNKPLAVRHKVRQSQQGLFDRLKYNDVIIPVTSKDGLSNYNVGDVLNIYNEANLDQVVGIKIVNKYPLYYRNEYREPNGTLQIGDLLSLNGVTYVFLGNNTILNKKGETETVEDMEKYKPVIENGLQVTARHNGIYVWAKQDKDIFINVKNLESISKQEFFKLEKQNLLTGLGVSEETYNRLLSDNKPITLYKVTRVLYEEKSSVTPSNIDSFKYFTAKDLIDRITSRLSGDIKVIWYNKDTKGKIKFKQYLNVPGFTSEGKIYLNENMISVNTYVHELSHVILAALKIKDREKYQTILNKIDTIPDDFAKKYPDLTQNDLKEEYLVYLFSENFTEMRNDVDITEDFDWESIVKEIFKLPETSNNADLVEIMNGTIKDMLQISEDGSSFSRVFKDNEYVKATKLAAIKEQLKQKQILNETCK